MTKKEFREKMFKAKKHLLGRNFGCCFSLGFAFGWLSRYFYYLFNDGVTCCYWWGDPYKKENQLIRIDALSLFEEYCITEGIYKEF